MTACEVCGREADWARVERVAPAWLTRREQRALRSRGAKTRPQPAKGRRYCMDCVARAIERAHGKEG